MLAFDAPENPPEPGAELSLTFTWTTQRPLDEDYTLFIHLAAPDGTPLAQADGPPAGGRYPTWAWEPGDVVPDSRQLVVPPDLTGDLRLLVGWYRLADGQRLPITMGGAGDALELATLHFDRQPHVGGTQRPPGKLVEGNP